MRAWSSVETPGGRIHIRWDYEASATPNAQLAFFAEFLATAGVYESWIRSCPLRYANSSGGLIQRLEGSHPQGSLRTLNRPEWVQKDQGHETARRNYSDCPSFRAGSPR
jgi:hypothetical protein